MKVLKNLARGALDALLFFVPIFITEDVVVSRDEDGELFLLCPLGLELESDDVVGKIKVRSIAWLGMGLKPKTIGELEDL